MRVQDGIAYPSGPITLTEALAVRLAGEAALNGGCRAFDLSGVTQVDSSALSVLLAWRRHAQSSGREFATRNLPAGIVGLIDLYGVKELLAP